MSIQTEDYILIPARARIELKLKGNDLLIYSLIHGFTKDGVSWFTGSLSYISEWVGCNPTTASESIHRLLEKNVIEKISSHNKGQTHNKYRVILKTIDVTNPHPETGGPPPRNGRTPTPKRCPIILIITLKIILIIVLVFQKSQKNYFSQNQL